MNDEKIAKLLSELGHPTRLGVFRLLVRAGETGLAVGEVQQRLGIPAATLSHHLHRLIGVGLVRQFREGRVLYCVAQLATLRDVVSFLDQECCTLDVKFE